MAKLQHVEHSMQQLLGQKQTIHAQQMELNNALEELEKTKGPTYKILGGIMVAKEKKDIEKELKEKKEMTIIRIKSIEKQEEKLKEQMEKLQEETLNKK